MVYSIKIKMKHILQEKVKDLKKTENEEINNIKDEYDIKIQTFKEKYKQLEQTEFNYLSRIIK
jgi:hypothetical protein